MKPKAYPASKRRQSKLFDDEGPALLDFIDRKHPLVRMADSMQWKLFETHWSALHSGAGGRMVSSGRQVAGLLMLKYMEALSDEHLTELWVKKALNGCSPRWLRVRRAVALWSAVASRTSVQTLP